MTNLIMPGTTEWFRLLAPVAWLVAAFVAKRRMLWLRGAGFTALAFSATYFQFLDITTDDGPSHTTERVTAGLVLWSIIATTLLFVNIPSQVAELGYLCLVAAACTLMSAWEHETDWRYVLPLLTGATVPAAVLCTVIWGRVTAHMVQGIVAVILCTASGVVSYFAYYHYHDYNILIGTAYLTGALGAAFAAYATRDPRLSRDYHVVPDLFRL